MNWFDALSMKKIKWLIITNLKPLHNPNHKYFI